MVKKTYKYDSDTITDFTESLFKEIKCTPPDFIIKEKGKKVGEGVWKSDTEIIFKKNNKKFGSLKFPKKLDGVLSLTADGAQIIKVLDVLEKKKQVADKNKLTPEKTKGTLFEKFFDTQDVFGGIEANYSLFSKVNTELKKAGVKTIEATVTSVGKDSVNDTPTLFLNSNVSGRSIDGSFTTKFKNIIWAKYEKELRASSRDNIITPSTTRQIISKVGKEEVRVGKIDGLPVIHYYVDRNILISEINPFILIDKYDKLNKLPSVFTDFFDILKELKITKTDVTAFKRSLFISNFMGNVEQKIKDNRSSIESYKNNIVDYERSLSEYFQMIHELRIDNEHLEKTLDSKGESIFEEIEKAKKIPFVKNVTQNTSSLSITFVPTTLVVNNFSRNGKEFGKRTFYLGEYTFNIKPGSIKIKYDDKTTAVHPHSNGSSCCFGDGEGRKKMFSLLGDNKISEVAKMLWFWIKTYRSDSAYVHYGEFYDDCISKGFPIWDEKNKQVEINDASRIKTGEQRERSKSSVYDDNKKQFGNLKVF